MRKKSKPVTCFVDFALSVQYMFFLAGNPRSWDADMFDVDTFVAVEYATWNDGGGHVSDTYSPLLSPSLPFLSPSLALLSLLTTLYYYLYGYIVLVVRWCVCGVVCLLSFSNWLFKCVFNTEWEAFI